MPRNKLNSVREVCEEFLLRGAKVGQSPEFAAERERTIRLFMERAGAIKIEDLIADDLESWIESNKALKSNWSKQNVARIVKRPFSWAWNKGLIDRNPLRSVTYPTGDRTAPMTEDNFRRILREAFPALRRALLFMWWTGCRTGELCALQWEFIDAKKSVAILHKHKTAHSRKDRAARQICLPAKAVRLLLWMLGDQREKEPYVFLSSVHRPRTRRVICQALARIRKRLRIPTSVRLYGIRHGFGTRMAMAGVPLKTLSTLMGHTTTRMSEHYIHLAGESEHLHEHLEKALATRPTKEPKP